MALADDLTVHRVGGAAVADLRLNPQDAGAIPPGISVLIGGTPEEAADQMRTTFPGRRWRARSATVGSAVVAAIRSAGFDVIAAASTKLPNHGRIVHPAGIAGFTDANLAALSAAMNVTTGC